MPWLRKIGVDREMAATFNLMKTAAIEEGIRDQRPLPGELFEALQDGRRVQLVH